jgi:hypothetical protein
MSDLDGRMCAISAGGPGIPLERPAACFRMHWRAKLAMLHCAPGRSAITRGAAWRRIRQRRVMKSLRTLTSLALRVLLSVQAAVPPDPSNGSLDTKTL